MSHTKKWVDIGNNVRIAPGVILGEPGFGYRPDRDGWQLKDHPYRVVIEDNVEIGANTVIDRGRWRDTIIGQGTKIDAHVFIAHNVQIGRNCLIIANTMIAGSCTIGDNCWIGPSAQITDHTTIGDHSRVGIGSVVLKDIPPGQTWVGNPAHFLRENNEPARV
jgi:UDP-3-O-[3-hydroxymyristoyl] glucosamine N-acyltransferase